MRDSTYQMFPELKPVQTEADTRRIAFSRPYMGREEIDAAAAVIGSGWIVGGPRLEEFEQRFASRCGAAEAVGVANWTTGAFLVLHAWGIGPGDEVIVPSLTFIATVNVIRHVGAVPVFGDVNPETYNLDPRDAAQKITGRTRVIMPVDQLGLPADLDAFNDLARKHNVRVLDDAACALGSCNNDRPVGSLANVTVFSLHARKVITTGEGGMILTNDGDFAARLRRLRHQGMSLSDFMRHDAPPTTFETYPEIGYNFRITDIQAAIGLAQLDRLDDILERRKAIAERYQAALAADPIFIPPYVPPHLSPNWQTYQIAVRDRLPETRNTVMNSLHAMGVPSRRGVMASHLEPPYRNRGAILPNTEQVAASTLQLPIHPTLTRAQQDHVLNALQLIAPERRR